MAATPNCQTIETAVLTQYPDARFGRHNCRHVGSNPSKVWSQHAASEPALRYYGNGLDITHQRYGYSSNPLHQVWLLRVKRYIRKTFPDTVRLLLAPGNAGHSNHVHVDTWPKMWDDPTYLPPCKGGKLTVVYEDGTRDTTFGALAPPPPPPTLGDDMALRRNDTGRAVVFYQQALIAWDGPGILEPHGADGDYGAATLAAVEKFQINRMELNQTADWPDVQGIIDGPTASMLNWYHLIKYGVHALNQPADTPIVPLPPDPKPHDHNGVYADKDHPHNANTTID